MWVWASSETCSVGSVKCKVGIEEFGAQSVTCLVWAAECKVSMKTERKVGSVQWRVFTLKSVQCSVGCSQCTV